MLYIASGTRPFREGLVIRNHKGTFQSIFKNEWLKDEFIQKVLTEVDQVQLFTANDPNNTVIIFSRFGQTLNHMSICGGTRTVILAKYYGTPNKKFIQSRFMGDNILPYLFELSKTQDIYLYVGRVLEFDESLLADVDCEDYYTHKKIKTYDDFVMNYINEL